MYSVCSVRIRKDARGRMSSTIYFLFLRPSTIFYRKNGETQLTTQALHASLVNDNKFKENYIRLLEDLNQLNVKNRPSDCDVLYSEW